METLTKKQEDDLLEDAQNDYYEMKEAEKLMEKE